MSNGDLHITRDEALDLLASIHEVAIVLAHRTGSTEHEIEGQEDLNLDQADEDLEFTLDGVIRFLQDRLFPDMPKFDS